MGEGMVFDAKAAETLAEDVTSVCNGTLLEKFMESFNIVNQCGDIEGVDAVRKNYMRCQDYWNETIVPKMNVMHGNLLQDAELAKYLQAMEFAAGTLQEDIGSVEERDYDAAKDL